MGEVVYLSQVPLTEKESSVLVISCSASVILPHVREFLEKHFQLPEGEYELLAVPGGAQFLLLTEYLPKFSWAGQKWLRFLAERHPLRTIIVIGHENCSWYNEEKLVPPFLHSLLAGSLSLKQRQQHDLVKIASHLREVLPGVGVETFFAEKGADHSLHFVRQV